MKIEPRKLTPFVPAPVTAEQRAVPSPAAPAPKPVEAPAPWQPERPVPPADAEPEVEQLIDVRNLANYGGFVLRSVARHKMLAAATFLGVVLVVVAAAFLLPRTYHVEVKLLAQRNAVMAALSNPGRAVPWDADAPTRAAAETVLRRDNLIDLIAKTDLINEWDRRKSVFIRLKEWSVEKLTGYELTPEDKLDALVWRLEHYMIVNAGPVGDGTVTIDLYWPDAEIGYKIVETARQAFLDARQEAETSAISESIKILEDYSSQLKERVNRALTDLSRTRPRDAVAEVAPPAAPRPRRAPAVEALGAPTAAIAEGQGPTPNPEVMRLASQLRDKQEALEKLEADRQQALSTAQATLAALKSAYTAQHPSVQNAQQKVDTLQVEPPQIAALKAQVEELEIKYEAVSTADAERMESENARLRETARPREATTPAVRETVAEAPPPPAPRRQVPEFADITLRTELSQLQSILERTDGARIEYAVSEAAFKYRYTVIKPAQIPREPESPNVRLLAIAGLLGALFLSVAAAVAKDLISNRIVEAWQVERQLGLPILGSVRLT